jgi:hypothetical protein
MGKMQAEYASKPMAMKTNFHTAPTPKNSTKIKRKSSLHTYGKF